MVNHVIVDKLDIAYRQLHLKMLFFGKLRKRIERLPLSGGGLRRSRYVLQRLDIGSRVVTGEQAIT